MTLLYLILAILPSLLIGLYLYKKDFKKESTGLLTGLFFGGIGAAILTIIYSTIIETVDPNFIPEMETVSEFNIFELFIKVLIGIALVEEFSKWLFSYFIGYKSREFDEVYDILLYCGFVALGFATFENIVYVFVAENSLYTSILRALTAVPGHVCDAILMGYLLSLAKKYEVEGKRNLKIRYLILSIVVPMLSHGLYDFLIMSKNDVFVIIWLVFLIALYIFVIHKIRVISKAKKMINPLDNSKTLVNVNNDYIQSNTFGNNSMYSNRDINNSQKKDIFIIKYCPNCGNYEPNANYCSRCGNKIR